MPTFPANPLGPNKEPLNRTEAEKLYREALNRNDLFQLETGEAAREAIEAFVRNFKMFFL